MTVPLHLDRYDPEDLGSDTAGAAARIKRLAFELRAVVDTAAARELIMLRLDGPDHTMVITFDGQEDAPAALMHQHFVQELAVLGVVTSGPIRIDPKLDAGSFAAVCKAFDAAIARMRVLLVEYHSFTSGGVPYVFATTDPVFRARGIALYRYPARAAVTIEPEGDSMRIRFAPGLKGEVTSSGFYIPTRVTGDFEVSACYRLGTFEPGPDSACLALFVQNEASSFRAYAQLTASGDPPTFRAQAGLRGLVAPPWPARREPGAFRIVRKGHRLSVYHRIADAEWCALGHQDDASLDDLIIGCKIWTKISSGGLEAEIHDLRFEGQVASEQGELPAVRPDPRNG